MYYVIDTTVRPAQTIKSESYPEILTHLDGMSKRHFGQTRKQRMIVLEELGHGSDDNQGVNFVRSMAETFNMGVVRDAGLMRCDIVNVALYQKPEFGD